LPGAIQLQVILNSARRLANARVIPITPALDET